MQFSTLMLLGLLFVGKPMPFEPYFSESPEREVPPMVRTTCSEAVDLQMTDMKRSQIPFFVRGRIILENEFRGRALAACVIDYLSSRPLISISNHT